MLQQYHQILNKSLRMQLGSSLEDFIIGCKFKTQDCNIGQQLIWKYDSIYDNCFQFNTGFDNDWNEKELETVERVGKPNGLILALNLNHELSKEFLIVNPNIGITIKIDDNLYNSEFKGVHKEKDVIYNDIDLIDILPGVVTNIVIEKVISKKLPKPYSSYEIEDGKFEIIK